MEIQLVRHPASPGQGIEGIRVDIARFGATKLFFTYVVTGDIGSMVVPGLLPGGGMADDLWQTTCFEAFVKQPGGEAYGEFNFSPSSQWAAYVFDGYRTGRQTLGAAMVPRFDIKAGMDRLELGVTLDMSNVPGGCGAVDLAMGLSAVIETLDRQKSYWAVAHPPGTPDFHHGDCFAAVLRAPGPA
jgi:hypothetical protein